LGSGGNADVYQASSGDSIAALKLYRLRNARQKGYERFRDEVSTLERCAGIEGVMKLFEFQLPNQPTRDEPAWFAMPIGQSLREWVGTDVALIRVVEAIAACSATLAKLHAVGISHRDVKPANLYCLDDGYYVGDFGLADFEEKTAITETGEKIGPAFYIAPEMLNGAADADGRPADVYSVAKTLWVLSTGQRYPLPGEMRRSEPAFRISTYVAGHRAVLLEPLIELATSFDVARRPTMEAFAKELRAWLAPFVLPDTEQRFDLSALASDIRAANDPYYAKETQRQQDTAFVFREANRIMKLLEPIVLDIGKAFSTAGLIDARASASPAAGCGASFYAAGYILASTWRGEVELRVNGNVMLTPHGSATVTVSFGYQINQHGKSSVIDAWKRSEDFLCGTTTEEVVLAALLHELRSEFQPFVMRAIRLSKGEEGSPPA
jgi:serine/threonine protein kinase